MKLLGKLLIGTAAAATAFGAARYLWKKYIKGQQPKDGIKIPDDIGELDLDTDGDGKPDAVAVDTDGDGKPDAIGFDTTGDGKVDTVALDSTGDGELDTIVTVKDEEKEEKDGE